MLVNRLKLVNKFSSHLAARYRGTADEHSQEHSQQDTGYLPAKNKEGDSPVILLVDDVEEIRDCIKNLLEQDGYHIEVARDEECAVENARRNHPDLLLVCIEGLTDDIVAAGLRIRIRAELSGDVAVVVLCCETMNEGGKISVGDNVYVICPDNFNQLRRFLNRLQSRLALIA